MTEKRRYINQHIAKAKSLTKNENDPGFDPLVDDKEGGTEDIEDLDAGMKKFIQENKSNLTDET